MLSSVKAFRCQPAAPFLHLPLVSVSRRILIVSKKELGGPRNYAPRTSTGGFHSTRLILYRLFSAYRPLLTAQPPVDDTPQRSGARGGPKKVEDPTTWPQDWGAADIEKFLDGKLSQGQRSTPFDEGSGEPKRTGVLDKAQEILSAAERAVASAQRAVESAQLNVDKETLIVNCLEATLGKDDNLSADDYGVLLKGIHPLIAKYIMFASTTNPFSMDEAEATTLVPHGLYTCAEICELLRITVKRFANASAMRIRVCRARLCLDSSLFIF